MIYSFNIRTENGEKLFYLTEENQKKLFKRILSTYGVSKEDVEILEEYEEDGWGIKLKKSYIDKKEKIEPEFMIKASKMYKDAGRKDDHQKEEYKKKHKYSNIIELESAKDLAPLLKEYKKVKVFWALGEKRGIHNYYAFVK